MKYTSLLAGIVLLALVAPSTHAQFGPILQDGFGVGPGVSSSDDATAASVTAGYVFLPEVEAGLSVSRSFASNTDATTSAVGPYAALYPVRASESPPLSIELSGTAHFLSLGGSQVDRFEARGGDVSGTRYTFGGALFAPIDAGSATIVPRAGVFYAQENVESSAQGSTFTNTTTSTSLVVSTSFRFGLSDDAALSLSPTTTLAEETVVGLSVSLLLPQ